MVSLTISAQNPIKKVYNESIDPIEQLDQAIDRAKQEGKFVICQLGGNWCIWCLRFADYIENDSIIKQTVDDNFVYIHVNYHPRRSNAPAKAEQTKALLKRLSNPVRFGFPVFVVLDETGKVLHIQDSGLLEQGDGYDHEKTLKFFQHWSPTEVKKAAL